MDKQELKTLMVVHNNAIKPLLEERLNDKVNFEVASLESLSNLRGKTFREVRLQDISTDDLSPDVVTSLKYLSSKTEL